MGRWAQPLEHRKRSKDNLVVHYLSQGEDEEICQLPTVVGRTILVGLELWEKQYDF